MRSPQTSEINRHRPQVPFPTWQLFILGLCRFGEPIAFMSIFPYIYVMVESFEVTKDDKKVALYVGMIISTFTLAEFSTGLFWGRLSDRIGRKPVLLIGLGGTGLSMLMFGFARNLPVALLARALGGLLNGNIGVLQTTVAELVKAEEHQRNFQDTILKPEELTRKIARAYTVMPFVWCLGSIFGPVIGGMLAQPSVNYPLTFSPGTTFDQFPFLLPNLVCSVIALMSIVVGVLFLEETHAEKKYRYDRGLEIGQWVLDKFRKWPIACEKKDGILKSQPRIHNGEQLCGSEPNEISPLLPPLQTRAVESQEPSKLNFMAEQQKLTIARPFIRQVVLTIVGYGILAYHTITFDQLFPVLLSTPAETIGSQSFPLKFIGGFGLTAKEIGIILSVQGIYSTLATVVFFPPVIRRIGSMELFRALAMTYPLLYFATPFLVILPENLRSLGIYSIVIWKCTFANFAYPALAIHLANSSSTLLLLGTINGAAASVASLCRAVGPAASGGLYSLGHKTGYGVLVWWCTCLVAIIGAVLSMQMTKTSVHMPEDEDKDENASSAQECSYNVVPECPVSCSESDVMESV